MKPTKDLIAEARELAGEVEAIVDVSNRAVKGHMYAGDAVRSGYVRISPESADLLTQGVASVRNTADALEKARAEVAEMRYAIQKSLHAGGTQRHHLDKCKNCRKLTTDTRARKYKYGCESLCKDALKVLVACGFKNYESLVPYASDWQPLPEPPEKEGDGDA